MTTFVEYINNETVGAEPLKQDARNLQYVCHELAKEAGWWTDPATGLPLKANVGEKLMLIVSEVAEAMEGHRRGLMDDKLPHRSMIEVELADVVIRAFDLAGGLGLDVAAAIVEKLQYNTHREDHKLYARMKEGGKAY